MKTPAQIVHEFVLTRLEAEPLAKRAELYRALGELAATAGERKVLRTLAAECMRIDRAHRQLVFEFRNAAAE